MHVPTVGAQVDGVPGGEFSCEAGVALPMQLQPPGHCPIVHDHNNPNTVA